MAKRSLEDRLLSKDAERRKAEKKAAKDDFVRRHVAALESLPVEFQELRARLRPGDGTLMKSQRVIDHLLFRKLFAETFANGSRDYVIESSGVRWHQSEEALLSSESLEEDHEIIFRIENIIRPAQLSFLCSTDQALAWAIKNMDSAPLGEMPDGFLYVPDWLIGALNSDDTDSAQAVLVEAGLRTCEALQRAQSEGDHAAQKLDLAEIRNLKLAIEAFAEIARLIELSPAAPNVALGQEAPSVGAWKEIDPSPKAQRIQHLVIAALNGLKKWPNEVTPPKIINWLSSSAEHRDFIRQDGGIYKYNNGSGWKHLSHDAIQNQLDTISSRLSAKAG